MYLSDGEVKNAHLARCWRTCGKSGKIVCWLGWNRRGQWLLFLLCKGLIIVSSVIVSFILSYLVFSLFHGFLYCFLHQIGKVFPDYFLSTFINYRYFSLWYTDYLKTATILYYYFLRPLRLAILKHFLFIVQIGSIAFLCTQIQFFFVIHASTLYFTSLCEHFYYSIYCIFRSLVAIWFCFLCNFYFFFWHFLIFI